MRKRLHPSLHQFIYPGLEWKTKNYTIRVDEVQDREYRYAAWFKGQSTLDQPYLILEGGTYHAEGSGGNHHYKFKHVLFQTELRCLSCHKVTQSR